MTIDIEQLRADMKAGTPGPWRHGKAYRSVVSDSLSGYDDAENLRAYGGHLICESVQDHNLRRIARLPDLEAEYLRLREAADALADAVAVASECEIFKASLYDEEGVEGWRWDHPDGRHWYGMGVWENDPPLHPLVENALDAYRSAANGDAE